MATRTFYIHPICGRGIYPVSEKRIGKRNKVYTSHIAWIDPPGAWYDDKWNVHMDGCDFPHASLEECKKRIADFYRTGDDVITFEETSEVYV